MSGPNPTVFIVDDDEGVRNALRWLIESVNLPVETFATAHDFLDRCTAGCAGCLVADVRMPRMSGLELQAELASRGIKLPVIIVTGHGDVEMAVAAMKAGAFDFIEKPLNNQRLLDLIQKAVELDEEERAAHAWQTWVRQMLDGLTPREREVLDLLVAGDPNKVVAAKLEISDKTVEAHRARIMEKMESRTFADLVKKALAAGDTSEK